MTLFDHARSELETEIAQQIDRLRRTPAQLSALLDQPHGAACLLPYDWSNSPDIDPIGAARQVSFLHRHKRAIADELQAHGYPPRLPDAERVRAVFEVVARRLLERVK